MVAGQVAPPALRLDLERASAGEPLSGDQAVATVERRHRELGALLEATQAVASSLDIEEILQTIVRKAAEIAETPVVRLFLLDERGQALRYRVGVGLPSEAEQDIVVPVGDGLSGQVAATGQPLAVADCWGDPRLRHTAHFAAYGLVSYLGLPVRLGQQLLGVLIFNTRAPRVYSDDEIAFLSAFARQAALAIQKAHLFRQEQQRRQQLEAVRAVGEEITRELDLTTLLGLIHRRAAEMVGAPSGAVYLWDEATQVLVPRAWNGLGEWVGSVRIRLGQGITGTVAARRAGMTVNDYRTSPYAHLLFVERTAISASMAEPLLYRDRLVGVITINNEGTGRPFTEQDRETLRLFAAQAAVAIENARLHEAALHRGAELVALLRATRTVMAELNLQEILERIVAEAAEITGSRHVKVLLVDRSAGLLRVGALRGTAHSAGATLPLESGLSGIVATTGQPLYSADAPHDPRNVYAERDRELGIVTYLGLPIQIRDEVLGVLTFNTMAPHQYSPEELAYLDSFADQAAIAIEHARLFAAAEQRAAELSALREIGQAITARHELSEVLEAVVAGAMQLLATQHTQITLWDEETQTLRYGAAVGPQADRVRAQSFHLGRGINGTVALTRQPMILDDYQVSPYALPEFPDIVATITVPVMFENRLLGVLHSHTTQVGRRFMSDDLRRFQMLATQAAIAIQNAQLLAALRQKMEQIAQQHRRAEVLLDISRAVTSTLEPARVLELIVEKAREITCADACGVVQLGPSGLLEYGSSPESGTQDPLALSAGLLPDEGLMARCLGTGRPVWSRDVLQDPDLVHRPETRARLEAEGIRAGLAVPIVPFSGPYAVLFVGRRIPHDYSATEISFLEAMAAHAAVALENARLYEEMRRQRDEVTRLQGELVQAEKMAAIGTLAAGIAHEVNNPLGFVSSNLETLDRYVGAVTGFLAQAEAAARGEVSAPHLARQRTALEVDYILQDLGPLLSDTRDGVVRVARIVRDLNQFSREDPSELAEADVIDCLEKAVSLAWNEIKQKAELARELCALPLVVGYGQQLTQVFLNLLLNAAQAIQGSGTIALRAGHGEDEAWVEVADTGCGIPPENLPRIFDPFFTTKPVGQGTGLGLAVSYGIVKGHGGRIEVASTPGQGTTFRVVLPVARAGEPTHE